MKQLLLFCFLTLMTMPALAAEQAASGPAFFEALYDVPVMPGLKEIPGQAMLFDKPDGRIASVTAATAQSDAAAVSRFYDATLPQLGWKKMAQNQYVRGEDRLVFELTKKPPLTVVHFTLSPNHP